MGLETMHLLPAVRAATGFKTNTALKAACERHGIAIVELSSKTKALRHQDYELLLCRATKAVPHAD